MTDGEWIDKGWLKHPSNHVKKGLWMIENAELMPNNDQDSEQKKYSNNKVDCLIEPRYSLYGSRTSSDDGPILALK